MTIAYNLDVSSTSFHGFVKIIFRWKGSIWKSVWAELLAWCVAYYIVMAIYRILLTPDQRHVFEALAVHCDEKLDYIPLTFMLGFFVSIVVDRWRLVFNNIGFIDNVGLLIAHYVRGNDDMTRLKRRNLVRYLLLIQVLVYRDISVKVRKRFPNIDTVVEAGYFMEHERVMWEATKTKYSRYWVPANWAFNLVYQLRKEGKIESDVYVTRLVEEIKAYRSALGSLCNFDWVPVPLAYTQVVFTAVRVYFIICLVSRQFLISDDFAKKSIIDTYVPFMTIIGLTFTMGWLKVAEALLNPLGNDDDDFEVNFMIDRNTATGFCMADMSHNELPHQHLLDKFLTNMEPMYSEDMANTTIRPMVGSATLVDTSATDHEEKVKMVPHNVELEIQPNGNFSRTISKRTTDLKKKERATTSRLASIKGLRNKFSLNRPRANSYEPEKTNPFEASMTTRKQINRPPINEVLSEDDESDMEGIDVVIKSNSTVSTNCDPSPSNEGKINRNLTK
uniref:Bestrophin homolog n=1 Tax=Rhabditophanes sp. KR3021 TaxID=114890 RepID=A0AC35U0P0_9BILA